jgi:FAD/FMN-containing dehydrogenase
MTLSPSSLKDLSRGLSHAYALGEKVESVELGALNQILKYTPEDMTVTVEAGVTLEALQTRLAEQKQWLPIDPPRSGRRTLSDLLSTNASGPRRFGCGMIRDYLIGLKVALADGRLVRSGGEVVKNVAGYDLGKLFIGSQGSLGVIAEATFKLRPLPESERFVGARCESLDKADELIESVMRSELTPIVIDLYNLGAPRTPHAAAATLLLGFAGTVDEVEWQWSAAAKFGLSTLVACGEEEEFWADPAPAHRLSVMPSRTIETLRRLNGVPFVARAGNGIIYHRGSPPVRRNELPLKLMRRLKEAYDPKHILPELPW